jgi:high-affinity nickel permease
MHVPDNPRLPHWQTQEKVVQNVYEIRVIAFVFGHGHGTWMSVGVLWITTRYHN